MNIAMPAWMGSRSKTIKQASDAILMYGRGMSRKEIAGIMNLTVQRIWEYTRADGPVNRYSKEGRYKPLLPKTAKDYRS